VNIIYLIGNVGKDPEIRTTQGGTTVASFSLATSERWKGNSGERHEQTTWHNCVVWGALSKVVEDYVNKGSKIAVVGRLDKRKYTSRDNEERQAIEVRVDRLELLADSKKREHDKDDDLDDDQPRKRRASADGAKRGSEIPDDLDDDIPF
jgi:single-strand DNA-binding protein